MTKTEVLKMYAELMAHAKDHTDGDGCGNAAEDLAKVAYDGVRTNVHFTLQEAHGNPPEAHDDDGDPEMHHMRQKAHFKKLWKQTDAIIAAAGLTEKGLVS